MNKLYTSELNQDERLRYSRHFLLPEVGLEGQIQLRAAKVLCVGAGGLGSPLLLYLAAAGVGTIGIVDDDRVELTNLQRQVLYSTEDLGKKKAVTAKTRISALNPNVQVNIHDLRLTKANALEVINPYDIVVDGTDNFATRYLINDACFHLKRPNVFASIFQFAGQCSVFTMEGGPCYRCVYESVPVADAIPNCGEAGVLGVLPGLLGTIQATEVIKLIIKIGQPLRGRLLTIDALTMRIREFSLQTNPNCRLCVHHQPFEALTEHEVQSCAMKPNDKLSITVQELHELQKQNVDFILLDVREPFEYEQCNLNALLIPLGELTARLDELDRSKLIVVHCKAGPRSQRAALLLQEAGFSKVKYLEGGILAWHDPSPTAIFSERRWLLRQAQDRLRADEGDLGGFTQE
jgi:molybdopterin/thiamine biosynthesis adenylyltransferase/rhodanese-related sulfurtransferase